jgi:hypothetical protein
MRPGRRIGKRFGYWVRPWTPVLAVLLVVGAPGSLPRAAAGDVNGDRTVDVLDLQRLVADVLNSTGGGITDLNGDGVIDILDLQLLLAEAARAGETAPDAPESGPPAAAPNPPGPSARPASVRSIITLLPAEFRPDSGKSPLREGRPRIPRDIERYLFTLTPNAPPVPVWTEGLEESM